MWNPIRGQPAGLGPVCHSQQDALCSLQQLAACGVDEDAVLLQGGTSCLGQTAGPGAAAVAADAVAVPGERVGRIMSGRRVQIRSGFLNWGVATHFWVTKCFDGVTA